MSQHFHIPIRKPEDIIPYLAKGESHWKKGYSAYELAHGWLGADGIPGNIKTVLNTCPEFADARFVDAFFEREVDLRTPGRASQTDLMVLLSNQHGLAVVAVEGKMRESFGDLVGKWNDASAGKERRLSALCETLGLAVEDVDDLRYQLIHRTASAVYEAQRYRASQALMLVHSFSDEALWFDDFSEFADRMGIPVERPNTISESRKCEDVTIRLGWVTDEPLP